MDEQLEFNILLEDVVYNEGVLVDETIEQEDEE